METSSNPGRRTWTDGNNLRSSTWTLQAAVGSGLDSLSAAGPPVLTPRSVMYSAFRRCCQKAGIQTETTDSQGEQLAHVDLHSLRRTFATSLIVDGADPKSVPELLGHSTLDTTMRIDATVNGQNKRQALGKLPYGQGTLAPEGILPYTGREEGIPVQNGPSLVTKRETGTGG